MEKKENKVKISKINQKYRANFSLKKLDLKMPITMSAKFSLMNSIFDDVINRKRLINCSHNYITRQTQAIYTL